MAKSAKKGKKQKPQAFRPVAEHRKARHLYEFLEELECGIELQGTEVKSLREGQCSLAEAYVRVKGGELFLVGATIPEYKAGSVWNHKTTRDRRLLAHRKEIDRLARESREKGITIVPLAIYFQGSKVKLRIALARGKRLHDKRQQERDRDDKRDMERATSRRR